MKRTYIVIPFFILILFGCDVENSYNEAELNSSQTNVSKEKTINKETKIKSVDNEESEQSAPIAKPNSEIIDEQDEYNPDYRTQEEINDEESNEVQIEDNSTDEELSNNTTKIIKSKKELEDEKLDGD